MRAVGIGLVSVVVMGLLWQTPTQAAPPSSGAFSLGASLVGHPPGPPKHGPHCHHPPVYRGPYVVLPPPPPPPPPRRVYYVYPPAVYYSPPPRHSCYESYGGSFYYYTPRGGFAITW